MSELKTLGENIDDLILTIARAAHCTTQEAVDVIIHRTKLFDHDTQPNPIKGDNK